MDFLLRKARKGAERTEEKTNAKTRNTCPIIRFFAHSCDAVLIRVKSHRAKNLNRTHVCRTSVAEPRKPCFTPQQAKIRRETGTLPFTLFNQSAADLDFFASVKDGHLNTEY